MTGHADTIRPDGRKIAAELQERAGFMVQSYENSLAVIIDAEKLDALLAERQQAQDERDEWEAEFTKQAEKNRLLRNQRQQAIDALREANEILEAEGYPPIRLSLGEQP